MSVTVPEPQEEPAPAAGAIRPVLPTPPVGRRRRPSGEPPPLPRTVDRGRAWLLGLGAAAGVLWLALSRDATAAAITRVDVAVLRGLARLRWEPLTTVAEGMLATRWPVRLVAWATIATLIVFRRFHHLAVFLAVVLAGTLLDATLVQALGRMRPIDVAIAGPWEGYAHPSRPVAAAALVATGAVLTLVPKGGWRTRAGWAAAIAVGLVCSARLYLAVDHPTDVFAALVVGAALPVVAYRMALPADAFPVSYRRGTRAHVELDGRRRDAIRTALDHQLGLDVISIEPFGFEASAGSTPLRLTVRRPGQEGEETVFAKLYARVHLRSDRWYKLSRAVLYGRLEDEKPFSSVRRLVEYEDHMLRLLRDAGLPTPRPLGFAEITPEREYLLVMEFIAGAEPLDRVEADVEVIDSCLDIVRRLWDAGVAHRDIKPSNVLAQGRRGVLIDVAFATVRPTPWRQAVDLANMMLTLALRSSPELVHQRALRRFAPDDIAEAFAASRSITIPTQLRDRLRADPRDLVACFQRLVPPHARVPVQRWSVRRVALGIAVLAAVAVAIPVVRLYLLVSGLL